MAFFRPNLGRGVQWRGSEDINHRIFLFFKLRTMIVPSGIPHFIRWHLNFEKISHLFAAKAFFKIGSNTGYNLKINRIHRLRHVSICKKIRLKEHTNEQNVIKI